MVDLHTGIQDDVIAQRHAVAHIHLRVNLDVLADGDTIADVGKRTHIHIIGEGGALTHMNGLLDASLAGTLTLNEVQQVGKGFIGILDTDECCFHLMLGNKILAYKNGSCLGCINKVSVFGIGEECQATGRGFLDFGIIVNHGRGFAIDRTVNHCRKLLSSNFHEYGSLNANRYLKIGRKGRKKKPKSQHYGPLIIHKWVK